MDQRAADALARIMDEPNPVTAVEVRCARRGRTQDAHLVMSVHPLGGKEFLVWRRPGSATGRERDAEKWQRDGVSSPDLDEAGFADLPELALIVFGPDADSARALLGVDFPALACRCGLILLGPELADEIHAALTDWWTESHIGPCPPKKLIAT